MNSELISLLRSHKIVELNHVYEELMPVWPTHAKFFCSHAETIETGDGSFNCQLLLGDHCGSHVDSPSHFIKGGKTIEQIDLRLLIGRGVCMDFSNCANDSEITAAMLQVWEDKHGIIECDDIVLLRTGYDRLWHNRPQHQKVLSGWSGLADDGADYLLAKGVRVVGTDAMSLDRWSNKRYPAHQRLLGNDCLILENMAHLYLLPYFFTFIALPLRIKGGSASPIRAIALLENSD